MRLLVLTSLFFLTFMVYVSGTSDTEGSDTLNALANEVSPFFHRHEKRGAAVSINGKRKSPKRNKKPLMEQRKLVERRIRQHHKLKSRKMKTPHRSSRSHLRNDFIHRRRASVRKATMSARSKVNKAKARRRLQQVAAARRYRRNKAKAFRRLQMAAARRYRRNKVRAARRMRIANRRRALAIRRAANRRLANKERAAAAIRDQRK